MARLLVPPFNPLSLVHLIPSLILPRQPPALQSYPNLAPEFLTKTKFLTEATCSFLTPFLTFTTLSPLGLLFLHGIGELLLASGPLNLGVLSTRSALPHILMWLLPRSAQILPLQRGLPDFSPHLEHAPPSLTFSSENKFCFLSLPLDCESHESWGWVLSIATSWDLIQCLKHR